MPEYFVLFKSYFDAGNDPNNHQHRYVTLTAIYSDRDSLVRLCSDWRSVLHKHSVGHLHTTDAIKNGQHGLLGDAVDVIAAHIVRDNSFRGIIATPVTIDAHEFRRVRDHFPDAPQVLSEGLAIHTLNRAINGCQEIAQRRNYDNRTVFCDLYFDRGEPYRGHIIDRFDNPMFKRAVMDKNRIDLERYFRIHAPIDSRDFPELQAADIFSWSYNRYNRVQFYWQQRLLEVTTDSQFIGRDTLLSPDFEMVAQINAFGLPKRARR